jgi:hypothetical protein
MLLILKSPKLELFKFGTQKNRILGELNIAAKLHLKEIEARERERKVIILLNILSLLLV